MKIFKIIIVLLCFSQNCFAEAFGSISYGEAVYISSQQCVLIQRMTKILLLKQKSPDPYDTKTEFDLSQSKFETNLFTLKNNSEKTTTKIRFSLRQVQKQWTLYKQLQLKSNSPLKILDYTEQLIRECTSLTDHIKKASLLFAEDHNASILKEDQEYTIQIASRQSMLSQQLAVYFLACELRSKNIALCNKIEEIRALQKQDVEFLIFNSANNDMIEQNINLITVAFDNLDYYVANNFNKPLSYKKIIQFTNEISMLYDKVTEQYLDLYGSIESSFYANESQSVIFEKK